MRRDRQTVRLLYRKLLTFYPRSFRERFAESVEQTFDDLYNDRKREKKQHLVAFASWMVIETSIGIVNEHVLLIGQEKTMRTITKDFTLAASISFILVLPLVILELLNNPVTKENPSGVIPLFAVLWLLPTVFIVILKPILRSARAGKSLMAKPLSLLLRVASLMLIATVWGWGLIDQFPCFLGVPNCD
jgi:hypothetical protein